MPELPEVETVVQSLLEGDIIGKKIATISITYPKLVERPDKFIKEVEGTVIQRCYRRGKFILFDLSCGKTLLVHLRMTGKLLLSEKSKQSMAHIHAVFIFSDGSSMLYSDVRKFGRFTLVENAIEYLSHLGLEMVAEDFSLPEFCKRITQSNRSLKTLLLDQTVIAGLGNIYADEALYQAELHPKKRASTLTKKELTTLATAIQSILKEAIKRGGSSLGKGLGNFLNSYGKSGKNQQEFQAYQRTGLPCRACSTPIKRIVMGQRSTHFCPSCQTLKIL